MLRMRGRLFGKRSLFPKSAPFMPVKVTNGGSRRERSVEESERKAAAAAARTIEVTIADATMRALAGGSARTLEALITMLRHSR